MSCELVISLLHPPAINGAVGEIYGIAALEVVPDLLGGLTPVLYKEGGDVAKLFYYPGVIGLFKVLWLIGLGFLDRTGRVEKSNQYDRQDSEEN